MLLGKKLGSGSQGEVFEVSVQGRPFALKLVRSRNYPVQISNLTDLMHETSILQRLYACEPPQEPKLYEPIQVQGSMCGFLMPRYKETLK